MTNAKKTLAAAAAIILLLAAAYWWARIPESRLGEGEPPAADGRIKLIWVGYGNSNGGKAKRIIDKWYRQHPDIEIEYREFPNNPAEYMKSLDVALAVNEPMDVMMMNGSEHIFRAKEGVLLDFGPFMKADGFDAAEWFGSYMEKLQVKNSYYFMPSSIQYSMLYYNKDMFDAAGLAYPDENTTLQELAGLAGRLSAVRESGRVYGFVPTVWQDAIFMPLLNSGWLFLDESGQPQFTDGRFKQALEWYKGLQDAGAAPSFEQIELAKWDARFLFAERQAAMIEGDWETPLLWNIRRFDDGLLGGDTGMDFRYGVTFYPRLNEEEKPKAFRLSAEWGYAANAATKHPAEAYRFAKFLTTEAIELPGAVSTNLQANEGDFRGMFNSYTDKRNRTVTGIYPAEVLDSLKRIRDETAAVDEPRGAEGSSAVYQNMERAMRDIYARNKGLYFNGKLSADDFIRLLQEEAEAELLKANITEGG